MGHPGAPNHDHHRSVWFAHNKVFGHNFWADTTACRIEQKEWMAIEDGNDYSRLAVLLDWLDGHDPIPLMKQTLIVEFRPIDETNWALEIQATFTPVADQLELQKTNFGFLAVRVSKQISDFFGGGTLTNSEGAVSEKNIFGKPARWMDYSGKQFHHESGREVAEGITYIDHPDNTGQPTRWHVRADGWMGASPGMEASIEVKKNAPLTLRYLLLVHAGAVPVELANRLHEAFSKSKPLEVKRATKSHHYYEIGR